MGEIMSHDLITQILRDAGRVMLR